MQILIWSDRFFLRVERVKSCLKVALLKLINSSLFLRNEGEELLFERF